MLSKITCLIITVALAFLFLEPRLTVYAAVTYTVSASAPATVSVGDSIPFNYSVNSSDAGIVLVDLEVSDPYGNLVYQASNDNQVFAAGETKNYTASWSVPQNSAGGSYTIDIGIFGPNWNGLLSWQSQATTFTVSSPVVNPDFNITTSVSPATASPADTINISSSITSQANVDAFVDITIADSNGTIVYNQWFDNQTFIAGETKQYNPSWQIPTDTSSGVYTVNTGIFEQGYGNQFKIVNAAIITVVTASSTPSPTPAPTQVLSGGGGGGGGGGGDSGGGGGGGGSGSPGDGGGCNRRADLNGDGRVNITDLSIFLRMWGQGGGSAADLNCSGKVDITDLSIFLRAWSR